MTRKKAVRKAKSPKEIIEEKKAEQAPKPQSPPPFMQPVPHGFREVAYYPEAGIRVTQSLDGSVCGIQFSEHYRAIRGGANCEVTTLADEVVSYDSNTRQWLRDSTHAVHANLESMKRLGTALAERRSTASIAR